MTFKTKFVHALALLITACHLTGCVVGEGVNALAHVGSGSLERHNMQRQVQRSARDWCLTIRGSQVIPVYPLDEDVQPGDVYIVDTPIDKLKSYWNRLGYLPIDHRFGRIPVKGYKNYYDGGYGVNNTANVPRHWQFPNGSSWMDATGSLSDGATTGSEAAAAKTKDKTEEFLKTAWPLAPRAGFPSQTIRIKKGEGFNAALPIQGVPVALGALGAREAVATVTLSDAYTYGLDEISLRNDLETWSQTPQVSRYLKNYASSKPPHRGLMTSKNKGNRYIRVVTRVYLVRGVNVSISNTGASSWKLSGGDPKDATAASDNLLLSDSQEEEKLLKALAGGFVSQSLKTEAIQVTPAPTGTTTITTASTNSDGSTTETTTTTSSANPNPLLPELEPVKKELDLLDQQLDLAERRDALSERQAAINARNMNREFQNAATLTALSRSSMKDSFGGYQLPGGTLRVTSATHRSISMNETFTRPLVIGYHALEFAIREDGTLSTHPVSTFGRLDRGEEPSQEIPTYTYDEVNRAVGDWFNKSASNRATFRRWLHARGFNDSQVPFILVHDIHRPLLLQFARENNIK